MKRCRARPVIQLPTSAFAGFPFVAEWNDFAVRLHPCFGLSYRDLEEPLSERGIAVDHVTVSRRVQRITPILAEAAFPGRHAETRRWFVDESYVKVSGSWRYVHRAGDEDGHTVLQLCHRYTRQTD